jgi:2-polyprenyl-6-methoxyphenol hydroxylase-like FAD-dependent oxidoreductase
MQEVVLYAAEEAGAEVIRGSRVTAVTPGSPAEIALERGGSIYRFRAPLVIGADGRNSRAGRWAGFRRRRDPARLIVGGALLEGLGAPRDSVHGFLRPGSGDGALCFPQRSEKARVYFIYRKDGRRRPLSGKRDGPAFVRSLLDVGFPGDWLAGARFAGPLAMFDGSDSWIDHPYSKGVALIGDAAASNDPSWGHGLSLALRDVRLLSDALCSVKDIDGAGHAYASGHDSAYAAIHTVTGWMTDLLFEVGPEADRRRERALRRMEAEPDRRPDLLGLGPNVRYDDEAKRRYFGEE